MVFLVFTCIWYDQDVCNVKETMNDTKNAIEPCSGSHLDRIFVVMDIVCIVDTENRLVETQSQGYIFCLYFYLIIPSIP